jgi:hypothetical protein
VASADAERLYGLPLDEFTAARDELAKAYRKDGRKEDAEQVTALRKPVLAAWVVNRLARDEPATMRALVDAAAAIKKGDDGAERAFREAVDRLTGAARELLAAQGRSPEATLHQVAATLRAGAASERELLLAGTLVQTIEASGFGAMAGASLAPQRSRTPRAKAEPRVDRKAVEAARRALAEARDEARRLERDASAAEREARKARQAADDAREHVGEAEKRLAEARGQ